MPHSPIFFPPSFLSSRFDTLDQQSGLLSLAPLRAAYPTLDSALVLVPPVVRVAHAILQLVVAPSLSLNFSLPGPLMCPSVPPGMGPIARRTETTRTLPLPPLTPSLTWRTCSSLQPHHSFWIQSLPPLASNLHPLLQCLQPRGFSD